MWGTKKVITPTNGLYTVDLAPASCSHSIGDYCMIGGYTSYVIQEAEVVLPTETPTPAAPLPTQTLSPTEALTPTQMMAPTETPTTLPTPSPTHEPTKTPTAPSTATTETWRR